MFFFRLKKQQHKRNEIKITFNRNKKENEKTPVKSDRSGDVMLQCTP